MITNNTIKILLKFSHGISPSIVAFTKFSLFSPGEEVIVSGVNIPLVLNIALKYPSCSYFSDCACIIMCFPLVFSIAVI